MTVKTPSIQTQKLIINHKKKPTKLKREKKKMMMQSKTLILKSPNKRLSPKLPKVRPNSLLRKTPLQMKTMMTQVKNLNPKKEQKADKEAHKNGAANPTAAGVKAEQEH